MKAREAIRKDPVTVAVDHTIKEAAQLMNRNAVGALVVVDQNQPVGIVTDRDLVVRALARGAPADARIDSVMTTELVTLDADADLRDALKLFRSHAIRRLPLTEDLRMVGMLTVDDLVIDLTHDLSELTRPVTGQTLFGHPEAEVPATTAS